MPSRRATISSFTRHHPNVMMTKAKISGNYPNSVLAKTESLRLGFDEAILLDAQGMVAECTGENIFLVRKGTLYTPPDGTILEGLRAMGGEWRVLVMPDHPTPCALKTHTSDPVPFVVYVSGDEQKARGVARRYNEKDAREQGIFIPEAHTIMDRLLRR